MKIRLRTFVPLLATICLAVTASFADVNRNSNNDGGNIPDNDSGGYLSTVTITENEIISNANFSVEGLSHSWIGDLIISISHAGKSATLMHRVGTTSSPGSIGDSSDVNGTYMFQDAGASIWTEAANGDTSYVVSPGTYSASGQNEALVDLNSIFAGETTQGDWVFNISDTNATQTGSFVQTSVSFVSTAAVPEPGTMATIVVGTLFGGIFLRRRQHRLKKQNATE